MKEEEITEEFLKESNAIERVYDEDSLQQAQYAWEYLIKQKEMTIGVIKKTHKILMLNLPLQPDEKGYFRKCEVSIGYRFGLNYVLVPEAIQQWCSDMNFDYKDIADFEAREFQSKAFHVEYEKIHPFVDGNGRTGRMFMNWWRLKNGLPLLVIHEGKEQMEYYKWFNQA